MNSLPVVARRYSPIKTPFSQKAIAYTLNKPLPKYFSSDEIKKILSDELKEKDYTLYFFCLFLWNTGARVSEAISVVVEDIDLKGKVIRVKTLKRPDHFRAIPLQNQFIGEVAIWINQEGLKRGDRLFQFNRKTAYNYVREACILSDIKDERCHPHTFRHSFAVNCILHGVPVTVLREWLGHRDITKTLIYTQILASDSRMFLDQVKF